MDQSTKIVGIMQPYLFPYIGYFQTLAATNDFVVYDDVQFIKGGWINRNNLLIGGQKVLFSVALADASPNKLIRDIEIKDDFSKLLKTIAMAYSRAPNKEAVMALIEQICAFPDKNLARFAGNSLRSIAAYLDISTNIIDSSALHKDTSLKGQSKVIAICQELHASTYINSIGGRELYDKGTFVDQGIKLIFLQPHLVEYKQFDKPFIPWLSIIDVLMFNSPAETRRLLEAYELS